MAWARRAEKSFTHRHLCEFTGLDLEMAIDEHYSEVLDVLDRLFVYIFSGLRSKYGTPCAAATHAPPTSAYDAACAYVQAQSCILTHMSWSKCYSVGNIANAPHLKCAQLLLFLSTFCTCCCA